jgi:hypothetical protein
VPRLRPDFVLEMRRRTLEVDAACARQLLGRGYDGADAVGLGVHGAEQRHQRRLDCEAADAFVAVLVCFSSPLSRSQETRTETMPRSTSTSLQSSAFSSPARTKR